MIRSMTGFGQATAEAGGLRASVQVRSVNHRFADVRLRIPAELAHVEIRLKRIVLDRVRRGRVDVEIVLERDESGTAEVLVNVPLARGYVDAAGSLASELGLAGNIDLPTLFQMPGVLRSRPTPAAADPAALDVVEATLRQALDRLDEERCREGQGLQADLLTRLERMGTVAAAVRSRATEVPSLARKRIVDRLAELATGIDLDPARVAQEAAFLADRADVTEELVRLEGHLERARSLLAAEGGEPVGKPMDFLLQEIHRETNTINAKSADLDVSRHALDLKAEAEKVREQVMNLE